MMEEKKEFMPLAAEIIADQQKEIKDVMWELENLDDDMGRVRFSLEELLNLTDVKPENNDEIMDFVGNQNRMYMYTILALDYVAVIHKKISKLVDITHEMGTMDRYTKESPMAETGKWHKKEILRMINQMENEKFLRGSYFFVKNLFETEEQESSIKD